MSDFNPNPQTAEDHVGNVEFQLDNVRGYLQMARDRNEAPSAALIKANSLQQAVSGLVARLEADYREASKIQPAPVS